MNCLVTILLMNFRKSVLLIMTLVTFVSCTSLKIDNKKEDVISSINNMALEQKIGQLFVIRPEALDEHLSADEVYLSENAEIRLSHKMKEFYEKYPCGGFILFGKNLKSEKQVLKFTSELHSLKNYPLLYIDEEGGRVARFGNNDNFSVPVFESMMAIGNTGELENAFSAGKEIGSYLKHYGFDVDFAPIADVYTNPENKVIGDRAFGTEPELVGQMDCAFLDGLESAGVYGCLKHFPGHGNTKNDSHAGYAATDKNWQQLEECELIPFMMGIEYGAKFIMTAHISVPEYLGESTPSTLSYKILTEKLRGTLGYKGIIITDAMDMGAITKKYEPGEAAVKAILAGADIILMPYNYKESFEGVLSAVKSGEISEERINESVQRILELKNQL